MSGVIRRAPKRNEREIRRSTIATSGSRSSPRSLSRTVWLARVNPGKIARVMLNCDWYGYPSFRMKLPLTSMSNGAI